MGFPFRFRHRVVSFIFELLLSAFVITFTVINHNMETLTSAPVTFTQNSIDEVKRLMNEQGFDHSTHLRIGVKGGGCSGLSYILGFDKKDTNDDEYEFEGMHFIMNKSHGIYLMGMEIDWQDGLNSRGFTFKNPNASKTCGCGTSFAV
jgi:iron-sulfur cluster assembly accessory protein